MAKVAEVAAKVQTAAMMAKKSRGDIGIDFKGGAEVLNPAKYEGPEAVEVKRMQMMQEVG